jgi:hypothetical protein
LKLRRGYALAAAALFAVEVLIALFLHDRIVRPHIGDVLAVILVYLALRAVTPLRVVPAALTALAIAFAIEFAQLLDVIDLLGLRGNALFATVLGSKYDTSDLAAYTAGALIALAVERVRKAR